MKKSVLLFSVFMASIMISTMAVAESGKFFTSKIGAMVIVAGSDEFIANVEDVITTSNRCNKILNAELKQANPNDERQYLSIIEFGNTMIIRPSTGEFLTMPSSEVKTIAAAFIDQEIQYKYRLAQQ